MVQLYLSDLLKRGQYDLKRTLLIRHSLNHKKFLAAYKDGFLREYTQNQVSGFYEKYDWVLVFVGDEEQLQNI